MSNLNENCSSSSQASVDKQKEILQQRHYFLLEQLKIMASQVPMPLRQRLSLELLSALSSSLLDGTVFEIVKNLNELQHLSERNFFTERSKIVNEYTNQRNQLLKRHKTTEQACETRPHHLNIVQTANKRELDAFDKRMNDELHRFDLKIANDMDQKIIEQQDTMHQAGVFGFFKTNNPSEITLQMHLFRFILNLSKVKLPC